MRLHRLLTLLLLTATLSAMAQNEFQIKSFEHRPDRVITDGKQMIVIDFKFGKPKPEYHEQVRQYMALLQEMGHQNVTGYLWYVYTNQIETV